ncbi:SDR family oxidoreductase [Nocardia huaxiensis]|uniref:SDR family oxidoreductase n=1 Tax=Nocardia huaxiensis TaxID=2755382 RepID=A0A7D6VMG9_9NOCA|nr:SDR family oxidoreductase [Nocardia huaxiensis]QLY33136.1 SDR family oxidoreductase [Nocardia huaxiensis]
MLLDNKTAVIYGAAGSIGSALAAGFAAEGANCFLVGRTAATLESVAGKIRADGGRAETAVVDALDAAAVHDHAAAIVEKAGSLDISVNVIGQETIFGSLAGIPVADFAGSLSRLLTSQLITTQAAAKYMVTQESGVILFFGGSDYAGKMPGLGTVQIGSDTIEALRRQWACELGPHNVRVLTLRTGGIPESLPDIPQTELAKQSMVDATLLKRAATLTDVGHVAAFAASDKARSMTATQLDISCGAYAN